ncbi:unnamed protein product [Vicia faba]|uniref:protein S-acyltransferase n=1 Tax=Vicia faba TaxID=3906 RepID=A0AAV0YWV0_VICFA|nr:unnamed protein product [Vicia faba]
MNLCFRSLPCLSDPVQRSSTCMKLVLLLTHLIYAGVLFLFDGDLVVKTKKEPWFTALYLLLFVVTLVQYYAISITNPGYVVDVMKNFNKRNVVRTKTPESLNQQASSKNGSAVISIEGSQPGRSVAGSNATYWSKLVAELYPPGSTVSLHGQSIVMIGNHCQFWWYLCEETAVCIWTGFLYLSHLMAHITMVWWQDAIMILLLIALSISLSFLLLLLIFHSYLILTNQTTYELVRRRRITYLREIPERVHPFSKGVCRNIYSFCCSYRFEPIPTPQEIEEKSMQYTCSDVATCRCC